MSQHRLPHYSATNAGQSMHPPPTCQACHHGSFNIHPSWICNYFRSKPNQAEQHPRANNRTQLIVSIGVQTSAKQYHTTIKPFIVSSQPIGHQFSHTALKSTITDGSIIKSPPLPWQKNLQRPYLLQFQQVTTQQRTSSSFPNIEYYSTVNKYKCFTTFVTQAKQQSHIPFSCFWS